MKAILYDGLKEDLKKGMTHTAKIVLDAKVFGLIEDNENCDGWRMEGIHALYDKVSKAWDEHGHLPSRLPDDLRARHTELYQKAIETARENGWDPDKEIQKD